MYISTLMNYILIFFSPFLIFSSLNILMTSSSLLSDFFTSCFTLFSKDLRVCQVVWNPPWVREVSAHSFHLKWLPGLTVRFFSPSGVGTHMMILLLPFSLDFLEHFGDLFECHLKIHIDYINYVTIKTGAICLFTSSKEP